MSISRPTLLLIALILLIAVTGIWLGDPIQGLWRWPASLLCLAIAWERWRLPRDIGLERQIAATLALGETAGYSLSLSNPAAYPVTLETQSAYPEQLEGEQSIQHWRLPSHGSLSRSFELTPTSLGSTELGPLYLKQLGGLGLCWWTRRIDLNTPIRIEPARLAQPGDPQGRQTAGQRRSAYQHRSGVEFLDLHEYRPGDPLRSIDWKATARRGKPMVRRFEREQSLEMAVLIDCGRGSRLHCGELDRLHHYVNIAAKLCEFAALQGDRIACIAYAQQVIGLSPMSRGSAAVRQARGLLGNLTARNETANALNAALQIRQVLKHRGLVIFLSEIEQPEAAGQLLQAAKLLAGKHQMLAASLEDPQIAAALKQSPREWQDPYRQFAGLEYLYGRELTHTRLQRLGVAVCCAPPQELDRSLLNYYRDKRETIGAA